MMNEIFGKENFRNEIILRKTAYLSKREVNNLEQETESLINYCKNIDDVFFEKIWMERKAQWVEMQQKPNRGITGKPIIINGKIFTPKEGFCWARGNDVANRMYKEGRLRIEGNKIYILLDKKALGTNWTEKIGYISRWNFKTENSEIILKYVIESTSKERDLVMDFFLGSGTATAVAHKLKRKWIGVEIGEHFYYIVIPRMKKVLFFEAGQISQLPDVKEEYNEKNAGGFFKYHVLEQYEDSLENIEFEQKELREFPDYFVKYMLDFETRNSKIFLNIDALEDPFNYKIKIIENYEPKVVNVDLVETFNYLIGLHVEKFFVRKDNGRKYVFVLGRKSKENEAKTLVVWRSIKDLDFKKDKEIIDAMKKEFSPDIIYVNGDCGVKGFKQIESEFKALLW